MQRLKYLDDMKAEELVKENLGRSYLVYEPKSRKLVEFMIVGYCGNDIVVSMTDDSGFEKVPKGTVLMVHSPLNVSYLLAEVECVLGPKLRKI